MATSKGKPASPAPKAAAKPPAKPALAAAPAAKPKLAVAPAPVAKPAAKPAAKAAKVDAAERLRMIAEAAYYIAEKRGFSHGNHDADWAEAERQIDALLAKG